MFSSEMFLLILPCTGCPRKSARRLINNRTKAYCLIFKISFIWNKAQPNLDFDFKITEI